MPNLTSVGIAAGVPNSGTGTVSTIDALMADGGQATIGAKADAKSTATDVTPVTAMSVWKQISASLQLMVFGAGTAAAAQRMTMASDSPDVTVLGAKTDAKATNTDATSISMMQVFKQISASVQLMVFGAGTAAAAQRTTLASDDPAVVVLGAKTDAKAANTDGTSISMMQVFKQMSASLQAALLGLGTTTSRLLSAAASTNGTSVKASSGTIYAITCFNASVGNRFLKLYNKASAPTVGTDVPVLTFLIPPGGSFFLDRPSGILFSTGIAYSLNGAAADADTTALTAGDILCLNIEYA